MIDVVIECNKKGDENIPQDLQAEIGDAEWRKGVLMVDDISHFYQTGDLRDTYVHLKSDNGPPFRVKETVKELKQKITEAKKIS